MISVRQRTSASPSASTRYAGRYLLHCHNLEHEDMAMMANFTTVA